MHRYDVSLLSRTYRDVSTDMDLQRYLSTDIVAQI